MQEFGVSEKVSLPDHLRHKYLILVRVEVSCEVTCGRKDFVGTWQSQNCACGPLPRAHQQLTAQH